MLSTRIQNSVGLQTSVRSFATSCALQGGVKMKRKKQKLLVDNPHLQNTKTGDTGVKGKALENFDQHYGEFYGSKWNSMRLALLSRPKTCAVVNNFGDPELTVQTLKSLGCIDIGEKFHQNSKHTFTNVVVEEMPTAKSNSSEKNTTESAAEADGEIRDEDMIGDISLKLEDAKDRFIDPEERVIGEMSSSMYDFVPTTKLKGMEDFVENQDYYDFFKMEEVQTIIPEAYPRLTFPKHLRVFTYPRSNFDPFPSPRIGVSSKLNSYLLDGGSLLPVLALDLMPGDSLLDLCAAPGGKSLMALQTLYLSKLVCNDSNSQRLNRLTSIFEQYFGDGADLANIKDTVAYSRRQADQILDYGVYDKILCDVPCFSDRHSLSSDADNMFTQKMVKNRLLLPEEQSRILKAGLQYLKPGGALVYSTCTLTPVQNEGVINMVLKSLAQDTSSTYVVNDLTEALKPLDFLGTIYGKQDGISLGNLVVPNICNNFGPTYFCRIVRKS